LKKVLLLLILVSEFFQIFGQSDDNYVPFKFSGTIPSQFLLDPYEQIQNSVSGQKILDPESAKRFYSAVFYKEKEQFLSGNIYFNDEFSSYVKLVTDKLLLNNPELKNKINIYVTRYPSSNAYSYPDGTIFINIGMLSLAENEAQLAYIIAHEIAHYTLNHAANYLAKITDIKKEQINSNNSDGNIFRSLKFSRENEMQADAKSIEYLLMCDYNANESYKILQKFNDSNYMKFPDKINYIKWFGDKLANDTNLYLKSNKTKKKSLDFVMGRDPFDDLYETHPDNDKRIEALKTILELTKYSDAGKVLNTKSTSEIERLRVNAQYEVINNLYLRYDYATSLFITLNLLNQKPESSYLKLKLLQNLFWLSFYKDINCLKEVAEKEYDINSNEYTRFLYFINNIGLKEIKEAYYSISKSLVERDEKHDDLYFYFILSAENYIGKDATRFIYMRYKTLFPDGKYILFVENKLI
jgi:beta-barrel assembly-enhancing protease